MHQITLTDKQGHVHRLDYELTPMGVVAAIGWLRGLHGIRRSERWAVRHRLGREFSAAMEVGMHRLMTELKK